MNDVFKYGSALQKLNKTYLQRLKKNVIEHRDWDDIVKPSVFSRR